MNRYKDDAINRGTDEIQFKEFLKQLVKAGCLEGTALGITKLVIDKGRQKLIGKQEYFFQKNVIDPFVHEKCKRCGEKIPWCEMFFAIEEGMCAECDKD